MSIADASAVVNWEALTDEAVRHLGALLRFDTTNPPGNEIIAAMYIRDQLAAEGIETRIVEPAQGRGNVWARLAGNGNGRPLMLLSHLDVVPVERNQWTVDPFGGEIHDGFVYGRGAIDMKQMAAIELTLLLHFARRQHEGDERLGRDLVLLAVADEERHATFGMQWIIEHMPEWVDVEYALNEGGGWGIDLGGRRIYVCEAAQKGSGFVTLRAAGKPGHASIPHRENAVARLARAIARIAAAPLPLHVTPTTSQFINSIASTQGRPQAAIIRQTLNPLLSDPALRLLPDQHVADSVRAMLHNTVTPTILLQAGAAINVIPSEATAQFDARLIPGQTTASLEAELRRRIRDPHVTVTIEPLGDGYELSTETPLFAAMRAAIANHEPDALFTPYLFPAVSDSRFLVPRGVIPYGFVPHRPEPGVPPAQSLAHSHDERVSIANVAFGLRVLYDTITTVSR